ncbi:amino acid ABC transporter permease [Shimia sediminis]|uniref:amino acid ABC transporter permease n=1 Tax=Shimia sediminis TaxID=2497945 RepID=UPI000F8E7FC0|nr:amino acid ABC transporter permease [Shimia sediminis]
MEILDTFFNIDVLRRTWPLLVSGLGTTLSLSVVGIVASMIWGLLLALGRLYGNLPIRFLVGVYIDFFRSIPLLVLLIVIYYALPFVSVKFSPFTSAALALILVAGAYAAEIFRAGILAVPKGQFEASEALGLSYFSMMKDVVLPQAVKVVIPPLTNNSVNVLKDTALASVVAMPDLLKQATQAQSLAANPTPLIGAAIIYVLILWPLVVIVSRLETRFATEER